LRQYCLPGQGRMSRMRVIASPLNSVSHCNNYARWPYFYPRLSAS
jgi:hypothetical protein